MVERSGEGGEHGVPDDGLGWGFAGVEGGVGGGEVEEDLFGVPVEEGGKVYGRTREYGRVSGGMESVDVPASRSNLMWAYSSRLVL